MVLYFNNMTYTSTRNYRKRKKIRSYKLFKHRDIESQRVKHKIFKFWWRSQMMKMIVIKFKKFLKNLSEFYIAEKFIIMKFTRAGENK